MKTMTCCLFVLCLHPLLHAQTPVALLHRDSSVDTISGQSLELLEMGTLLTALGEHEDAYQYFRFVLRDFNHPELHNNAGVSAILEALYYFRSNEPEVKFRYPLQLDLNSVGAKSAQDFRERRAQLLRQAIAHFDTAILLDPRYAPAYLNKACALALLGENDQAWSVIAQAQQAANQPPYAKTALDLQILLGILYERQGDAGRAQAAFETAAGQGSALAVYNLNMLLKRPNTVVDSPRLLLVSETIDGMRLDNPYNLPELEADSEIALGPQLRFYHNLHPGAHSRFYFNDNHATGQQTYFLLTNANYPDSTAQKLGIGATRAEIQAAYGPPKQTLETSIGQIRVYADVILIVGKQEKLMQWAIYGETN